MSSFRQLMMRKKIPSIYKVLDWIQSSGTQWIDTGIKTNGSITIDCKLYTENQYGSIFGSRIAYGNKALCLTNTTGWIRADYTTSAKELSALNSIRIIKSKYTETEYIFEAYNASEILVKSVTFTKSSFTSDLNLYLFARNDNGTVALDARNKTKIYYFKIYDNGTLVRNFVPVLRKTDNELGMLDLVEGKFYPNAGTGKFVGSDEILLTKVGSPTITDGVVSGFSNSNYLTMPMDFDFGDDFELQFKFATGELTSNIQALFNFITEIRAGVLSNRLSLQITNTSSCNVIFRTSENVAVEGTIANTFSANTTYYVKYVYKNSYVTISLSTDGNTWTTLASGSISGIPTYSTERTIGYGYHNSQHRHFLGSIDFNSSYIIKNGTKYIFTA